MSVKQIGWPTYLVAEPKYTMSMYYTSNIPFITSISSRKSAISQTEKEKHNCCTHTQCHTPTCQSFQLNYSPISNIKVSAKLIGCRSVHKVNETVRRNFINYFPEGCISPQQPATNGGTVKVERVGDKVRVAKLRRFGRVPQCDSVETRERRFMDVVKKDMKMVGENETPEGSRREEEKKEKTDYKHLLKNLSKPECCNSDRTLKSGGKIHFLASRWHRT